MLKSVEHLLDILLVFLLGMTKLGCQGLEVTKLIVLLACLLLNRVHLRLQEVELTFEGVH